MPTKIRLQRKGKKGQPFYHLVIADGRAPRDGKFIEKIGTYNPMTHPATVELEFDRALYWVQVGAQPTDTARSILSREGVMMKHHLLNGAKKGALNQEQVEEKFKAWLKEKADKIDQAAKDAELTDKERKKKQLENEKKINEERAAALAKKYAKESAAPKAEEASEEAEEAEASEGAEEAAAENESEETKAE
jgi:small subunit ribosomal protein S16